MNIIDRYLLRQFASNFIICFVSLAGVYIIFDAFTQLEAFMHVAKGGQLLKLMAFWYLPRMLYFFYLTSSLLVLMSAMFTMAWIQRHHEMTALMASGISRIRIVMPVLIAALGITLLAIVNREVIIPHFAAQLAMRPSDLQGNVIEELLPQYDNRTDVLIRGRNAILDKMKIENPNFLVPSDKSSLCEYGKQWTAMAAFCQAAKGDHPAGYLLDDVIEPKGLVQRPSLMLDGRQILITPHDRPDWLQPNQAFVVSDVTVDELTGNQMLKQFASTGELIRAMRSRSVYFSADIRVLIHARIVQPLLDITLLFLGLPLVVARDNRNVFVAIGACMGIVAVFFLVSIGCQQLGASCLIGAATAAWAPLMLFVPAAAGMSSAMWER